MFFSILDHSALTYVPPILAASDILLKHSLIIDFRVFPQFALGWYVILCVDSFILVQLSTAFDILILYAILLIIFERIHILQKHWNNCVLFECKMRNDTTRVKNKWSVWVKKPARSTQIANECNENHSHHFNSIIHHTRSETNFSANPKTISCPWCLRGQGLPRGWSVTLINYFDIALSRKNVSFNPDVPHLHSYFISLPLFHALQNGLDLDIFYLDFCCKRLTKNKMKYF